MITATSPGLGAALAACRNAIIAIAGFSALINVLMLTGSLFMLEVYDRVLPSRSLPTLAGLTILAVVLFSFQAVLEIIRGRLLVRIGHQVAHAMSPRLFDLVVTLQNRSKTQIDSTQPIRDLDAVRGFISSAGPTALFDLPWVPLYLLICFAFHPLIGITTVVGALILVLLTVATELLSRRAIKEAGKNLTARNRMAEAMRRNAEVVVAMGMASPLRSRWQAISGGFLAEQKRASDASTGLGTTGRVLRMMLQSIVLAVGALLVIKQEASAGIIIASSILTGRALAPIDLTIANWKGFSNARESWRRLKQLLALVPPQSETLQLPAPQRSLAVEDLAVAPPGQQKITAQQVKFRIEAGGGLGIVGPSGSGKSSLARALVSVWPAQRGSVRLDGASIDQWSPSDWGRYIGYLPQEPQLLEGTIAENIARFDPAAADAAIVAAAQAAGVHDLIVSFQTGYETPVGDNGLNLSAGQRQRIALARALYGDPFLVVLDEPNSNLDAEGEEALVKALMGVRQRGGIVVVVAHRPSVLAAVDHLLVMARGAQQSFGLKDDLMNRIVRREMPAGPFKVVPQAQAGV